MTIHKSHNVTQLDKPRIIGSPIKYITLQIPVVDIPGDTVEKKKEKFVEEIDELLHEITSLRVNNADALSELFDVLQVMVQYLICYSKENIFTGYGAIKYAEESIQCANEMHNQKITNYAQERGWGLVRNVSI